MHFTFFFQLYSPRSPGQEMVHPHLRRVFPYQLRYSPTSMLLGSSARWLSFVKLTVNTNHHMIFEFSQFCMLRTTCCFLLIWLIIILIYVSLMRNDTGILSGIVKSCVSLMAIFSQIFSFFYLYSHYISAFIHSE